MSERETPDNPRLAVSRSGSPRRFYKDVTLLEEAAGYIPLLDGRKILTPAKIVLAIPVREFAEAVAEEWRGQKEQIDPSTMPLTKLANSALDGVATCRAEILDDLMRYVSSDLLCYRADSPEGLVQAQRDAWDPILESLRDRYGVKFCVTTGIAHIQQPPGSIAAVRVLFERAEQPFMLAALHMMTTLIGSALCALTCADGTVSVDAAWDAAHVDERHQERLWGEDEEALTRRNERRKDFDASALVMRWLGGLR